MKDFLILLFLEELVGLCIAGVIHLVCILCDVEFPLAMYWITLVVMFFITLMASMTVSLINWLDKN
jgi:hypothetical protein